MSQSTTAARNSVSAAAKSFVWNASAPLRMWAFIAALFTFVAGAATALSPCVLPVLPAVLGAGVTGGRRRPLGVVTGIVLAFTFATVALVYVIDALGLPDDLVRTLAIITLLVVAGVGTNNTAHSIELAERF